MGRFHFASLATIAFFGFASVASAADEPVEAATYETAPAVLAQLWLGFYAGLSLGARLANNDWQTSDIFPDLGGMVQTEGTGGSMNSVAARLGSYIGYNWQFSRLWVAGLAADIGWANNKKFANPVPGTPNAGFPTGVPNGTVKESWDGSVRGRLGYLVAPDTLLYGTGGVAWQRIELHADCIAFDFCAIPQDETYAKTKTGWTVGGGLEQRLGGNWLARIEYRYADFGTFDQLFFTRGLTYDDRFTAHVKVQTHTANVGLAYKF